MTDGEVLALLVLLAMGLRRAAHLALVDGWVWPVPSWNGVMPQISQGYAEPRHRGVDVLYRVAGGWDAPEGTPIVAANAGTVQRVARSPRGWSIVVDHGPVLTFYQHLETTAVRQGERVTAGQRLGTMGADPLDAQHVRHLHFEVWQRVGADVAHLDPQPLMAPWKVIQWTQ